MKKTVMLTPLVAPAPTFREGLMVRKPNRTRPLVRRQAMLWVSMLTWGMSAAALAGTPENPTDASDAVDGLDLFPVMKLPRPNIRPGGIGKRYWIDKYKILLNVEELDGRNLRETEPDKPAKLVVWDVLTGKVEDAPHRGELRCWRPDGHIILSINPQSWRYYPDKDVFPYAVGQYGQPLQEVRPKARAAESTVNPLSCEFEHPLVHSLGKGYSKYSLAPGFGYFIEPTSLGPKWLKEPARYVAPDGKEVPIGVAGESIHLHDEPELIPFLSSYLLLSLPNIPKDSKYAPIDGRTGPAQLRLWYLVLRDGQVDELRLPDWQRRSAHKYNKTGGAGITVTRRGVIYHIGSDGRSENPEAGMYLFINGRLTRILKGYAGSALGLNPMVSPDGCRIIFGLRPEPTVPRAPNGMPSYTDIYLMDVCKGELS